MGRWLERYDRGQRAAVWTEMIGLGADLRADEEALRDAELVARHTMRRARANVERLVKLLPAIGYEFAGTPFVSADASAPGELAELEALIGVLPLSLRVWFEEVGQVNLVGRHPGWDFAYVDPLVVEAPVDFIRSEFEAWEHDRGTEWDRGPTFEVPIAPDVLHKADVSGGAPYSIAVPNPGTDGLLLWERHQTTFTNYLRIAFACGGMPGWHPAGAGDFTEPASAPPPELIELALRLEPI
jgi:hypothetical protein